ncbi:MAG: SDR family oxidoreductase, partial [Dehalococcoidia bacterium]
GFTRVVARDLGRYGVTVNCIVPRAATRMVATIPSQQSGQASSRMVIQLGDIKFELGHPDMIAPMACYLASDQAWNINGQVFLVYGGVVALVAHPAPAQTIWKHGLWTAPELADMVPVLMEGMPNPAPPPPELEIPGRPISTPQTS